MIGEAKVLSTMIEIFFPATTHMIAGLHLRKADAFFIGKIDVDAAFQILEKTDSDAFDF